MTAHRRASGRGRVIVVLFVVAGLAVVAGGTALAAQLVTHSGHQHPAASGRPSPGQTVSQPPSAIAPAQPTTKPVKVSHQCNSQSASCGAYPDAVNSGVPAGMKLRSVPGQVSKGPGWYYDPRGWVEVDGDGAVLEGLSIPYDVDVTASDVTIKNDAIKDTGNGFGVSLRHTHNVTIENSDIYGGDAGSQRLMVGIKDIYGDCTGTRILGNNIWYTGTGIQVYSGLIQDNYIHNMGYISGDHINGITSNGGTQPLTIKHNTILVDHDQTDAIGLFEDFGVEANVLITNNLLAGGGYTIYGGQNSGGPATYNIVITNNLISTMYYPQGGYFGPGAAFSPGGRDNVWSGNVFTGGGSQEIPAPSD